MRQPGKPSQPRNRPRAGAGGLFASKQARRGSSRTRRPQALCTGGQCRLGVCSSPLDSRVTYKVHRCPWYFATTPTCRGINQRVRCASSVNVRQRCSLPCPKRKTLCSALTRGKSDKVDLDLGLHTQKSAIHAACLQGRHVCTLASRRMLLASLALLCGRPCDRHCSVTSSVTTSLVLKGVSCGRL